MAKKEQTNLQTEVHDKPGIVLEARIIKLIEIWPNSGQIKGLPKNPRFIRDAKILKLEKSLKDDPEFLSIRPLVVFPYAGEYVAICGNMRRQAAVNIGMIEVPCFVLNPNTPIEKLIALQIKDNISYGSDDMDILANEFDTELLLDWGMDLPFLNGEDFPGFGEEDKTDNSDSAKNAQTESIDPKCEIIIKFNANRDEYESIKEQVRAITDKFPGIELKG